MRVFRLSDSGVLEAADAPRPVAAPGEVLIRVVASGVTPSELGWYPTTHIKAGEARHHAVPGHEFSGIVETGAGEFAHGDAVFGMNDWFAEGSSAEYCTTVPGSIARKPAGLTHAEAATVPIGALTAWQGLIERAKLKPGERVLVHGGSGAVGAYAVQLARLHGAHVVATTSAINREFVEALGAQETIDYRTGRFEDAGPFDIVFDTAGGDVLERSWSVLRDPARMVTIVGEVSTSTDPRVQRAFFIVEPNARQLTRIAGLLEAGSLRAVVDTVAQFTQVPDAYAKKLPREGRGKVVVQVTEENEE